MNQVDERWLGEEAAMGFFMSRGLTEEQSWQKVRAAPMRRAEMGEDLVLVVVGYRVIMDDR